jgi:hypothetical protein
MINDVSALGDEDMAGVIARKKVPVILNASPRNAGDDAVASYLRGCDRRGPVVLGRA